MTNKPDVTIVVVSWNTRDILRNCLASVFDQTRRATFEAIVVDNASSDGSAQMVRAEFPRVTLIANQENRGFAAANNQAIRGCRGRAILLLNSDTIVQDGAIDKSLDYLAAHPEIGVLGPKVFWPSGERQSSVFRFPGLLGMLLDASHLPDAYPEHWFWNRNRYAGSDWDQPREVDVVAGCFLLVRREVIDQVGVLDEEFFMYGEEAEWCYRIKRAGWRIVYYPGASIIHIWGASSAGKSVSPRAQLAKRRGYLMSLRKTRGRAVTWVGNLIMLFGLLPRVPLWLARDTAAFLRRQSVADDLSWRLRILGLHLSILFRPGGRY